MIDTAPRDGELLARFADAADQEAFAELVRRHGGLVHAVCRRVVGNAYDADDAAQATFLTLARKARSLRSLNSVAGWLHRVAHYVSLHVRRAQAVQRRAGGDLDQAVAPAPSDESERRRELVDQAVAALPERYREPIVLHHLEGRTVAEVASALKVGASAASMRLTRGRELLRRRLERLGLSGNALGVAIASVGGAGAAPPVLVQLVPTAAAFAAAQAPGIGIAAHVHHLVNGATRMLLISKLKTVAAVVALALAAGLLPLGARGLWAQDGAHDEKTPLAAARKPQVHAEARIVDNGLPPGVPGTILAPGEKPYPFDTETAAFSTSLSKVSMGYDDAVAEVEAQLARKPALARAVIPSVLGAGGLYRADPGIAKTPLHLIAGGRFRPALTHVADLLLTAGADIETGGTRSRGWTPLLLSSPEFGDYLIAHGAKPGLAWYARRGDLAQVKALLAADRGLATATGASGATALHFAAAAGATEICEALVAAGARVDAADEDGQTPLRWAVAAGSGERGASAGQRAVIDWLPAHGAHWDLVSAIGADADDAIAKLLTKDPRAANAHPRSPYTPLTLAVLGRKTVAVRALLARGADPNLADSARMAPLHYAALYHDAAMATQLLDGGADATLRDGAQNKTAREWALINGAGEGDAGNKAVLDALDAPRAKPGR